MSFGIYLHIPFCRSFCSYCDFYHERYAQEREQTFVDALTREIELRCRELPALECGSIYFGGGTPSLLQRQSWKTLFAALRANLKLTAECEITVEANPESANSDKLETMRELGVNRLSLGVQSLSDKALELLGRRHNAELVLSSVAAARRLGFENISLDLLLGLPDSAEVSFADDLAATLELAPEHLSCYALTLEGGVPLQIAVEQGIEKLPTDDQVARDYLNMVEHLAAAGLEQYEISNFAQPGQLCRHNLNYWQQGEYLGFGPAAVSTLQELRVTNEPDLDRYLAAFAAGDLPPQQEETLTDSKRLSELIMLSLRQNAGLDLEELKETFGYDLLAVHQQLMSDLKGAGDLFIEGEHLRLSPQGMLRYNLIVAALLPD